MFVLGLWLRLGLGIRVRNRGSVDKLMCQWYGESDLT